MTFQTANAARGRPNRRRLKIIVPPAVLVALAVGVAVRLWLAFALPLNSDEAISGLMADRIRHGQLFTFYWGQAYGGAEPYVVAAVGLVARPSGVGLNLVPAVLNALSCLLLWRVGRRLVPAAMRSLAWMAAAALWVSGAMFYNSTRELGFRGVALACGIGLVLFGWRAGEQLKGLDLALFGLIAGIGWWSSPEVVYFFVPALGGFFGRRIQKLSDLWIRPAAIALAGFVVGASPWLATNIRTRFESLRIGSSPKYVDLGYFGRVEVFFHETLPIMLGLKMLFTGHWIGGAFDEVVYVIAGAGLVLMLATALVGAGDHRFRVQLRFVAAGVILFPWVFAAFPATGYWQEGMYGVYVIPLVAMLTVGSLGSLLGARSSGDRWSAELVALGGIAVVVALGVAGFSSLWLRGHPARFLDGWGDPNQPVERTIQLLSRDDIHFAFAQYWVAYDLDYLGSNRVEVTPTAPARWAAESRRVESSSDPAWLFYAPPQLDEAAFAFSSSIPGPDGLTETEFLAQLRKAGVTYRIEHADLLDAVIPTRPTT